MKKKLLFLKNNPQEILHREKVNERLRFAAAHDVNTVLKYLGTTGKGLPSGMVEQARERYGDNVVTHGQKESLFTRLLILLQRFCLFWRQYRLLQISGWLIRVKKTPLL